MRARDGCRRRSRRRAARRTSPRPAAGATWRLRSGSGCGRTRTIVPGPSPERRAAWLGAALVLATVAVYAATWRFAFVGFDDPEAVSENVHVRAGLSLAGVRWAFTSVDFFMWHPLTTLSHMLDCSLYGLDAGGHHVTNVILHVVATLLLFAVLVLTTAAPGR